jgi:hypothetical protein
MFYHIFASTAERDIYNHQIKIEKLSEMRIFIKENHQEKEIMITKN